MVELQRAGVRLQTDSIISAIPTELLYMCEAARGSAAHVGHLHNQSLLLKQSVV